MLAAEWLATAGEEVMEQIEEEVVVKVEVEVVEVEGRR